MGALGIETVGLAASFFFEDRTVSRSVTLNLEADLEDFPAPTHSKQISILILSYFYHLITHKHGYLLDMVTEPKDTS